MKHVDSINAKRLIRLVQEACLIVYPPGDATSDSFSPFWLMSMPLSQCCWFHRLARMFHRAHGRSIATLLMLDCTNHQWSTPVIPAQRCTRDGTIWVLRNEDFADMPPSRRVVGSCQNGAADSPEDIVARLPPHDGLHLFLHHSNHKWVENWFLRIQGEVAAVPPRSVLADDRLVRDVSGTHDSRIGCVIPAAVANPVRHSAVMSHPSAGSERGREGPT